MVHRPFMCSADDDDDTVEELRERLRCHPDCIRESLVRYVCDAQCNGIVTQISTNFVLQILTWSSI